MSSNSQDKLPSIWSCIFLEISHLELFARGEYFSQIKVSCPLIGGAILNLQRKFSGNVLKNDKSSWKRSIGLPKTHQTHPLVGSRVMNGLIQHSSWVRVTPKIWLRIGKVFVPHWIFVKDDILPFLKQIDAKSNFPWSFKEIQTLTVEYKIDQLLLTRCKMKRYEQGFDILRERRAVCQKLMYLSHMRHFGSNSVNRTVRDE